MENFSASQNKQVSIGKPGGMANPSLIRITKWVDDFHIPFALGGGAMIIMLLWAGLYKMTTSGAEGIIPLVTNSPLISWHFKLFGPYVGSDLIGATEITAAIFIIIGFIRPQVGIVGTFITTIMFFITGSMVITTPDSIVMVNGMGYMSFLGLFLFKDIVSLGLSFYLLSSFRRKALSAERNK